MSNTPGISLYDVAAKSINFKLPADDSDGDSDQEKSTTAPVSVHFSSHPVNKPHPAHRCSTEHERAYYRIVSQPRFLRLLLVNHLRLHLQPYLSSLGRSERRPEGLYILDSYEVLLSPRTPWTRNLERLRR